MTAPPLPPMTSIPRESKPGGRPLVVAGLLSLLYVLLCAGYILFSSEIAASISTSIPQLQRIEMTKGIWFVLVTGLLYFVASFFLLKRIAGQEERILRQEHALSSAEGRAMAGIFASSVAHDMGNLLTAVRINLHLLKPELDRAGDAQASLHLVRAVDDLSELVQRLATIGREGKAGEEHQSVDLCALVRRVSSFAPSHMKILQCKVSVAVTGSCVVRADESLLARMIFNLILNAAEATGKGGKIEIRLRRAESMVHLEVHDNGPGIPIDMRQKVFDPFYTSKPNGTGLGLLSVRVCAVEHHGTVTVTDSDLGGACFTVTLPAADPPL